MGGKSPFDNAEGLYTDVPVLANEAVSIGTPTSRLLAIYVKTIFADSETIAGNFGVTGALTVGGSTTSLSYLLPDASDKNHSLTTYGSGTGYTLTATPAAVVMGTSSPTMVLDKAGTYLIFAKVNLEYVGATFAANRTVTLQLNRTNNTPGVLTASATALGTNVVTTVSGVMAVVQLPVIIVTTTNTNDIIVPFASVSVVPTAGSLQATESSIVAVRLYT